MDRPHHGFVVLLTLGLGLRLFLVWAGWCDDYVLTDDAYYYFTIAGHVASGLGSTFDGLAPTNGYHPLFMLLLVPVFAVLPISKQAPWVPIHVSLSICALLDVGAGMLLYRIGRRWFSERGALWALGVWMLSPFTVLIQLRGLESALNVALLGTWILIATQALAGTRGSGEGRAPTTRDAALLGLVSGLAVLARTDNGFLLPVTLIVLLGIAGARGELRWSAMPRFLIVVGIVAALIAAPWFGWNIARFGSPFQVSGVAKMQNTEIFGHLPTAGRAWTVPTVTRSLAAFAWVGTRYVTGEEIAAPAMTRFLAPLLTLATLLVFAIAFWRVRKRSTAAVLALTAAAVFLIGHAMVYGLVLRSYATWYAAGPLFAACVALAGTVADTPSGGRSGLRRLEPVAAVLAIVVALAIYGRFFRNFPPRPRGRERDVAAMLEPIERAAPGPHTIGIYNAGAVGYFAPTLGPYHVVNLDCVVNNRAFGAWKQARYYDYVVETTDLLLLSPPGAEPRAWMTRPQWQRLLEVFPRWEDRLQPGGTLPDIYGPKSSRS